MNTAALSSKITYIDGEKGTLMHRGYPIGKTHILLLSKPAYKSFYLIVQWYTEQLAEKSDFLETAYLLIYGDLPSKPQSERWRWEIMHHTFLSDDLSRMMQAHRYDAHPMAIFASTFSAMSAFAPEANPALQGQNLYINDKAAMNKQIVRILGKATTVAANAMRIRINRPFGLYPLRN